MIRSMRFLCPLACLAACTFSRVDPDDGGPTDGDGGGDGGGTWFLIDELSVLTGPAPTAVMSSVTLAQGVVYRLRASGKYFHEVGAEADAEYVDINYDPRGDIVSGIDVGLAVDDSSIDEDRTPRWGAYRDDHVYEVEWTGNGAPIAAQLHDGNYTTNAGTLTLQIFERR